MASQIWDKMLRGIGLVIRLTRLHRPTGIWLLMLPCWWSLALALDSPNVFLLGIFFLGAVVMRSAGCVINDMFDRKIDRQVTRTKSRPLASGTMHLSSALWVLIALLAMGASLLFSLGQTAIILGLLALLPVIVYPLMKRVMDWPQLFLALTFNTGTLIAWAAATHDPLHHLPGTVDLPALALYGAGIFWTLGYDTIYAHQDIQDDIRIGVRSSARVLGRYTRPAVASFYLVFVLLLLLAGLLAFETPGWPLFIGLFLALLHVVWQVKYVDLDRPESCAKMFRSNTILGWVVFGSFALEQWL